MASARLRKLFATIGRRTPHVANDAVGFAGAGAVAYGAWLIYPPAGFLVGGTLAMTLSILAGRKLERDTA
jgi:hypothetical protein